MKKAVLLVLLFAVLSAFSGLVLAAVPEEVICRAEALQKLDLLQGSNKGFELERPLTRLEALIILIRLNGQMNEANQCEAEIPFTDVADWSRPYVAYAYQEGLSSGISETQFGSNDPISLVQYLTFLLRSLGYNDEDFSWDAPYELAAEVGLAYDENEDKAFLRADAVRIAWQALSVELKHVKRTLAEYLMQAQVFSEEAYDEAQQLVADAAKQAGYSEEDLKALAEYYDISVEKVRAFVEELLRQAKLVSKSYEADVNEWIASKRREMEQSETGKAVWEYKKLIHEAWLDFWESMEQQKEWSR